MSTLIYYTVRLTQLRKIGCSQYLRVSYVAVVQEKIEILIHHLFISVPDEVQITADHGERLRHCQ